MQTHCKQNLGAAPEPPAIEVERPTSL